MRGFEQDFSSFETRIETNFQDSITGWVRSPADWANVEIR